MHFPLPVPDRGTPFLRAPHVQRALLVAMAAWTLVSLLMTLALYSDAVRDGANLDFWRLWRRYLLSYVPFIAYSWGLYLAFEHWRDALAKPRAVLGLFLGSMLFFMPILQTYLVALAFWVQNKEFDNLVHQVMEQQRLGLWVDAMLVSGSLALQVAIFVVRRNQVRERALLQAQADHNQLRLTLLQGQLEPHFLFNALNSVSALVRSGDRATALSALSQLAELLRYALKASKGDWNSVQDELCFVKEYLQLQFLRFGSGLSVRWHLDDTDWHGLASPPLLFQPLIENAIRHGVEAGEGHGEIGIALRRTPEEVMLTIENELPSAPAAHAGHGLGLATTRERLAMLYGDKAALRCESTEGRYTVTLSFPIKDWNDRVERPHR